MRLEKGMIQIYHGDGKGKTTAAIGQAIRASGCGLFVIFAQFLKGADTGEWKSLEKIPGIKLLHCEEDFGFVFQMSDEEKEKVRAMHKEILDEITRDMMEEKVDVIVLDEILDAINLSMIDEKDFIDFIDHKPLHVEMIFTGRNPKDILVDKADYVTYMKKEKHPFDKGISARKGIEM